MPSTIDLKQQTDKTVKHLKTSKPYDGFSMDEYVNSSGDSLVMLRRRNAPLADSGFKALVFDETDSKCIIGVTHVIGETNKTCFCRGIVLIEKDGTVTRNQREVRIGFKSGGNTTKPDETKKSQLDATRERNQQNILRATQSLQTRESNNPNNNIRESRGIATTGTLSDEENEALIKYALIALGVLCVLKLLQNMFNSLFVLLLPLLVTYAMKNHPPIQTFDAKKELKRVWRGAHLPEDDPNKPKSWLSEQVARATASVATEVATSLGHEVSFINIFGIFTFATVTVTVIETEFYWIGIFGTWKYLFQRSIAQQNMD